MKIKQFSIFAIVCLLCTDFSAPRAQGIITVEEEKNPVFEFVKPLNGASIKQGDQFTVHIRNSKHQPVQGFIYLEQSFKDGYVKTCTFHKKDGGWPFDFLQDTIVTLTMPDSLGTGTFRLGIVLLAYYQPPPEHKIRLEVTPSTATLTIHKERVVPFGAEPKKMSASLHIKNSVRVTPYAKDIMGRSTAGARGSAMYVAPLQHH